MLTVLSHLMLKVTPVPVPIEWRRNLRGGLRRRPGRSVTIATTTDPFRRSRNKASKASAEGAAAHEATEPPSAELIK